MMSVPKERERRLCEILRILASGGERGHPYSALVGTIGTLFGVASKTAELYLKDLELRAHLKVGAWASRGRRIETSVWITEKGLAHLEQVNARDRDPLMCFVCGDPSTTQLPIVPERQGDVGGRADRLIAFVVELCEVHLNEPRANLEEMLRERMAQQDATPSRHGGPA